MTGSDYVPDLAAIRHQSDALGGVTIYVGDGATVTRSMVRRRDHALIGHAPIAAQLGARENNGRLTSDSRLKADYEGHDGEIDRDGQNVLDDRGDRA